MVEGPLTKRSLAELPSCVRFDTSHSPHSQRELDRTNTSRGEKTKTNVAIMSERSTDSLLLQGFRLHDD